MIEILYAVNKIFHIFLLDKGFMVFYTSTMIGIRKVRVFHRRTHSPPGAYANAASADGHVAQVQQNGLREYNIVRNNI